jgi:hypothetical protein
LEGPGYIESEMNVSIEKVAGGFCYETFFIHGAGVREM